MLPHMFRRLFAVCLAVAALATSVVANDAFAARTINVQGNDFSWPQCPKGVGNGLGEPLPSGHRTFMIVGLTNGTGMHENPWVMTRRWLNCGCGAVAVHGWVGSNSVAMAYWSRSM